MTGVARWTLAAVACALLVFGCGSGQGLTGTQRALERAGYTDVEVTVRSGGGFDVVRAEATGEDADRAAGVVWTTLPVRFDQLVVALGPTATSYSYEALTDRFGPRDPSLDRRQVSEEVVEDGLDLMVLLTLAATVSVAGVVGIGLLAFRAARRARVGGRAAKAGGQAEGPTSGLGADSPTLGESAEAEGPESIPS